MKLLIVGGYGTFGGRLVDLLKNESRLELLVAGRSLERQSCFVQPARTPTHDSHPPGSIDCNTLQTNSRHWHLISLSMRAVPFKPTVRVAIASSKPALPSAVTSWTRPMLPSSFQEFARTMSEREPPASTFSPVCRVFQF